MGQSILGAILLITAVRFGLDVSRRLRGVAPAATGEANDAPEPARDEPTSTKKSA